MTEVEQRHSDKTVSIIIGAGEIERLGGRDCASYSNLSSEVEEG